MTRLALLRARLDALESALDALDTSPVNLPEADLFPEVGDPVGLAYDGLEDAVSWTRMRLADEEREEMARTAPAGG